MRKLLVSTLAVVGFATVASAQLPESVLVFDIRPTLAQITTPAHPFTAGQVPGQTACNAGGFGDGQVLRLMPVHVANAQHNNAGFPNFDADGNASQGNLYLYLSVNPDTDNAPACTQDAISSVGVNFMTTAPGTVRNSIASLAFTWSGAVAWNGTANGVYSGGVNGNWTGAKAVDVPVAAGPPPTYDTTGAATEGSTNNIGTLRVTSSNRDCTDVPAGNASNRANSTYQIKMEVNNLLITRVCSNASVDPGEQIAMGYGNPGGASECGALPEGQPGGPYVNGSTSGPQAANAAPDAIAVIGEKGDYNGDGVVNAGDQGFFIAAKNLSVANPTNPNLKQRDLFYGDWNGDGLINAGDQGFFINAKNTTATCP